MLISAGFDAAQGDPLGGCQVTPEGYAHLTHLLMGLAGGRVVLILEVTDSLDVPSHGGRAVWKSWLYLLGQFLKSPLNRGLPGLLVPDEVFTKAGSSIRNFAECSPHTKQASLDFLSYKFP